MDALDEEEAGVPDEVRLRGEPDLVVDLSPLDPGVRPLLQFREDAEPEGEIVVEVGLHADELAVFLVDPGPPRELLQDLSAPRVRLDAGPRLEGHDDRAAPVERLAPDDLELVDAEELVDRLRLLELSLRLRRGAPRSVFAVELGLLLRFFRLLLLVFLRQFLRRQRLAVALDELAVRVPRLRRRVDLVNRSRDLLDVPVRVETPLRLLLRERVLVEKEIVAVQALPHLRQERLDIRKRGRRGRLVGGRGRRREGQHSGQTEKEKSQTGRRAPHRRSQNPASPERIPG